MRRVPRGPRSALGRRAAGIRELYRSEWSLMFGGIWISLCRRQVTCVFPASVCTTRLRVTPGVLFSAGDKVMCVSSWMCSGHSSPAVGLNPQHRAGA